jgi:hypothetical protein
MLKQIFLLSIIIFPFMAHSIELTSCESTLLNSVNTDRSKFSDVCYTQFQIADSQTYRFLKWSAHWNNGIDKTLQSVADWNAAMSVSPIAVSGEPGWRLPSIKELVKISSFSNIIAADTSPMVLAKYWMLQQWFSQSPAITDAYIASSTYQGGQSDPDVKIMALNISSGKVEPIPRDFTGKTVYVVKVKSEEPLWQVYRSKLHASRGSGTEVSNNCLMAINAWNFDVTDTDTTIQTCNASDPGNNYKWLFEEVTGFFRFYNGRCLRINDYSQESPLILDNCKDYADAGYEHSARWNKEVENSYLMFRNIKQLETKEYYLYSTNQSGFQLRIYDYTSTRDDDYIKWSIVN